MGVFFFFIWNYHICIVARCGSIKLLNQKLKLEEGGKEILKENLFRRKQNQLCLKSPPNRAKRELTKLTNRKAANK